MDVLRRLNGTERLGIALYARFVCDAVGCARMPPFRVTNFVVCRKNMVKFWVTTFSEGNITSLRVLRKLAFVQKKGAISEHFLFIFLCLEQQRGRNNCAQPWCVCKSGISLACKSGISFALLSIF